MQSLGKAVRSVSSGEMFACVVEGSEDEEGASAATSEVQQNLRTSSDDICKYRRCRESHPLYQMPQSQTVLQQNIQRC